MKRPQVLLRGLIGAFGLVIISSLSLAGQQVSPQERVEQQLGPEGNAMGVPEPGSVQDMEQTQKARDPGRMHTPEESRQITLGGAEYFIEGEVLKVDGQEYTIRKDDSDERVKLVVNRDTNLDCAAAPKSSGTTGDTMTAERVPHDTQAPEASDAQIEQGQRKDETALGSGFRIGRCDLQPGDRVKAEVDDMGRVTTLKYLAGLAPSSPRSTGQSAGTGELAMPGRQDNPAQLDMTGAEGFPPDQYSVLPVPLGEMKKTGDADRAPFKTVRDHKGKTIGEIEHLIMDTKTGKVEYAVLWLAGGTHLHPVPWAAIEFKEDQGALIPIVDTSKYQLLPEVTMSDVKDQSPSIAKLVERLEVLRAREPKKAPEREGLGIKQPAAGGPHGEDVAGGGGPSGPRALPPGKAPGFEEEKKRKD